MASLKRNILYNYLWTASIIIYPIVTFPYASRVLGPEGIGITNYALAFTKYFILFGALGIPTYGIRAIAQARGNQQLLNSTFSELATIQFLATCLTAITFYWISSYIQPFDTDFNLHFLSFIYILSNFGVVDWFYKGIENFKLVALRTVGNKVISIILIFLFVNNENDYWIYFGIFALSSVIDALINFFPLKNYITAFSIKIGGLRRHLTPILILFSTQIAINIYINLDTVMLGLLSTNAEVGYYTASIKLVKLSLTGVEALGAVLIPQLTLLIFQKRETEFKALIGKSLSFVGMVGFPLSIGIILLSKPIIAIFAGPDFNDSVLLTQVLAPLIFIIGLSNIFGMQILVPSLKEKFLLYAVLIGSVMNLIMNFVLIPRYGALGASYATIAAEISVTVFTFIFAAKTISFKIPWSSFTKYFFISSLFIPISYLINSNFFAITNPFAEVMLTVVLCAAIYFAFLLILKDNLFTESLKQFKNRI